MTTTISHPRRITSKGQVTLPVAWRRRTQADAVVMREADGVLEIRAARATRRGDLVIFNAERDNRGRGVKAKTILKVLKELNR